MDTFLEEKGEEGGWEKVGDAYKDLRRRVKEEWTREIRITPRNKRWWRKEWEKPWKRSGHDKGARQGEN